MKEKDSRSEQAIELRTRAEEIARRKAVQFPDNIETLSLEEVRQTLQELRVFQIELEMQNEELRRTQVELDAARARYFDLYDLAPVGYVTVSEKGLILESNLTAAMLLGVARGALLKQLLSRFIFTEDQDIYYLHRKQLLKSGDPQSYHLRMLKMDGTAFWAHLLMAVAQDDEGAAMHHVVLSDTTEFKRTEEALQKAFDNIRTLHGILPICFKCKKIRNDQGYWTQVEVYVRDHTEAEFSHGICPECMKVLYPEYEDDDRSAGN